jgi:hypothetical protein
MSESVNKMGHLIDDLLAFSRIGRAETKKMLVSLEQLVKEVVAEFRRETIGRDIAWKIGALPACYGDRAMLRVVVVDLVSNAVKFTRLRKPAEIGPVSEPNGRRPQRQPPGRLLSEFCCSRTTSMTLSSFKISLKPINSFATQPASKRAPSSWPLRQRPCQTRTTRPADVVADRRLAQPQAICGNAL